MAVLKVKWMPHNRALNPHVVPPLHLKVFCCTSGRTPTYLTKDAFNKRGAFPHTKITTFNLIWMAMFEVNGMSHNGALKTATHPTKDSCNMRGGFRQNLPFRVRGSFPRTKKRYQLLALYGDVVG
jgi:hypothetical protein